MFQPDDEHALRQMLGATGELPKFLEDEYDIQRRMYCAAGGGGQLGPAALVGLCRKFDLKPPKVEAPARIDLQKLKRGARVLVKRHGAWNQAEFLGRGDNGQAHVRIDGEDSILAWSSRPDVFRIEHTDYVPGSPELAATVKSATEAGIVPVAEAATAETVDDPLQAAINQATDEAEAEAEDATPDDDEIDWASQQAGMTVWAQDKDGQPFEGVLHHTDEHGKVWVLPTGAEDPLELDPEDVHLP